MPLTHLRSLLLTLITLAAGTPSVAADAPQLRSVQVSPSGGVLLARFNSNVASVKPGATYSVNGGDPIALANPMWDSGGPPNSDWAWWPLGQKRQFAVLDDDRDAKLAGTGWANKNSTNTAYPAGYYFFFKGDQFSQSSTAADTATYTKTLPVPGRWRLSANLTWLYGPDRTTAQTYTVSDGAGVVGTFTVDLTKPPSWDRNDDLVRYHDLGHVTLRDTTLTVIVSNGATAGSLVTDALFLELDLPPPVAPGDTVTLSAPAGTFTTTGGAVGTITAQAVAHTTDDVWFPFDATRKPGMAVGYNKTFDVYNYGSRLYADRFRSSTGWEPVRGTFTVDDQGQLTAVDGQVRSRLWAAVGAGDDLAEWPNAPLSGTVVLRFKNPAGAVDPGCTLDTEDGGSYTFGPRAWDPGPGPDGKSTLRIPYKRPDFVPLGQATAPTAYSPRHTFEVSLRTTKVITDVECTIEEETPAGYKLLSSPIAVERYKGRGFGAMRFLDCMYTNLAGTVEYADWPSHAAVNGNWWGNPNELTSGKPPKVEVGLASVAPVTDDDIARYCRKTNFIGAVRATTTAPHGLVTGQRPDCRGPVLSFDSNVPDGKGGWFPIQLTGMQCVVTGPDTLILEAYFGRGSADEIRGPPTLGAEHKLDGTTLRVARDQVIPYADLMTFARECGVGPWVLVPHLMSDAGIAAMADATIAGTPAGTAVRVEYSNEPWNFSFPQQAFFDSQRHRFAYLDSVGQAVKEVSDPTGKSTVVPRDWMESYCHLAANAHRIFAERFAAAGRSADLRRVMGSQSVYAAFPTASICNYAFEHGITFDELAIETYVGSHPAQTRQYATDPTPAYDRLDVDGLIDVLGIVELLGGREKEFAVHRAVMAGRDSATGTPFGSTFAAVKMTSYEGGASEVVQGVSDTGRRRYQLAHRGFRHPRMYRWELARLQNLDARCGCALAVRYNADKTDSQAGDQMFVDWPSYGGGVGTGDPTENRNPWDALAHRPQTAGAMRTFAAAAMGTQPPAPTPTPTPTPIIPAVLDTIGARIAEAEAADADLRKALADSTAVATRLTAARTRATKASASLTAGLKRVGTAYRPDAQGEGISVYWADTLGKIQTIRPVPPSTVVPAGAK